MIPRTYQIMKRHICANCGSPFESGSPHALYCTESCQRTAKAQRKRARQKGAFKSATQPIDDNPPIPNPSIAQLDKYAELFLLKATNGKPQTFSGNVPNWTPPAGVIFSESFGYPERRWIMMTDEILEKGFQVNIPAIKPVSKPNLTSFFDKLK